MEKSKLCSLNGVMVMVNQADAVASRVLQAYGALERNGKPVVRANGVPEWTVLAGVVVSHGDGRLECVALATGVKASPNGQIENCKGIVLHDCHAEILAIRAFNRYVVDKGIDDIGEVYLYVSAPPCGDASMSLLNGGESWTSEPQPTEGELIRGRGHYNFVGHIRTKPGRTDSQLTMSKSCSDKLCLRQSRGLLLSPVRRVYEPRNVYLGFLVCPAVLPDFDRAFARWHPTHRFVALETSLVFESAQKDGAVPSTCSIVWTPQHYEVLNNGVRQGSKNRPSFVSRVELVKAAAQQSPERYAGLTKYSDLKMHNAWPSGWQRTAEDDFRIE